MKFRLLINATATATFFGLWHWNVYAGMFAWLLLGALYSLADYVVESLAQGTSS